MPSPGATSSRSISRAARWTRTCRSWRSAAACRCSTSPPAAPSCRTSRRRSRRSWRTASTSRRTASRTTSASCADRACTRRSGAPWTPRARAGSTAGTISRSPGSAGLVATAAAPDGVIEGIESPEARFCVGVQWHPENFWRTGEFRPLFDAFVGAARERLDPETRVQQEHGRNGRTLGRRGTAADVTLACRTRATDGRPGPALDVRSR